MTTSTPFSPRDGQVQRRHLAKPPARQFGELPIRVPRGAGILVMQLDDTRQSFHDGLFNGPANKYGINFDHCVTGDFGGGLWNAGSGVPTLDRCTPAEVCNHLLYGWGIVYHSRHHGGRGISAEQDNLPALNLFRREVTGAHIGDGHDATVATIRDQTNTVRDAGWVDENYGGPLELYLGRDASASIDRFTQVQAGLGNATTKPDYFPISTFLPPGNWNTQDPTFSVIGPDGAYAEYFELMQQRYRGWLGEYVYNRSEAGNGRGISGRPVMLAAGRQNLNLWSNDATYPGASPLADHGVAAWTERLGHLATLNQSLLAIAHEVPVNGETPQYTSDGVLPEAALDSYMSAVYDACAAGDLYVLTASAAMMVEEGEPINLIANPDGAALITEISSDPIGWRSVGTSSVESSGGPTGHPTYLRVTGAADGNGYWYQEFKIPPRNRWWVLDGQVAAFSAGIGRPRIWIQARTYGDATWANFPVMTLDSAIYSSDDVWRYFRRPFAVPYPFDEVRIRFGGNQTTSQTGWSNLRLMPNGY